MDKITNGQLKYNSHVAATLDTLNKVIIAQEQNTVKLFSYLLNQNINISNRLDINENNLVTRLVDLANIDKSVKDVSNKLDNIEKTISNMANGLILLTNYMNDINNNITNSTNQRALNLNQKQKNTNKKKNIFVIFFENQKKKLSTFNENVKFNIFYFDLKYDELHKVYIKKIEDELNEKKKQKERVKQIEQILAKIKK